MKKALTGALTALLSPMKKNTQAGGEIDYETFERFVEWQIAEGIDGLVPVGTTGESPTLSHQEHCEIVRVCVRQAAGRVPVVAGAGSNNTTEAIYFAKHAEKTGADAVLVVVPYYNRPSQEGLFQHYSRIAENTKLPIIVYNIPQRSACDMSIQTIARVRDKHPHLLGIKDAVSYDIARISEARLLLGDDFVILSGDDASLAASLAQGGDGIISVASNAAPKGVAELCDLWRQGKAQEMQAKFLKLFPLMQNLFCEPSPAPIKYALNLIKQNNPNSKLPSIEETVRLPLVKCTNKAKEQIKADLKTAGLIS